MKQAKYLFPRYFRTVGYIMLPLLLVCAWGFWMWAGWQDFLGGMFRSMNENADLVDFEKLFGGYYTIFTADGAGSIWWDELIVFGLIASFIFIAFSREKAEDEYVWKIRMESLVWAFIADAILIIAATFLLFNMDYVTFMAVNFFVLAALFIVKFRIAMFRAKKSTGHEE